MQAIFLPEGSDFIARNSAETVKITKEVGSIDRNEFIKGLQEQAIESTVSVTAGVHLPTDSESHVSILRRSQLTNSVQIQHYG